MSDKRVCWCQSFREKATGDIEVHQGDASCQHPMKIVERMLEKRMLELVNAVAMQFGFTEAFCVKENAR